MSSTQLNPVEAPARDPLAGALADAATVKAACEAVVTHLRERYELMPSVYLERGGRLRCLAVAGYWQIFDGIPPGAGVIGTTYVTGEPTLIAETAASDDYLEAVSDVRSEVCVPVVVNARCVGALNVESEAELGPDTLTLLTSCSKALASAIERMGGMPPETRAERLARHVAELAALTDAQAVLEAGLDSACDVVGMESAMIALAGDGSYSLAARSGPHGPALLSLSADELMRVADWVRASTSAFTIGDPALPGFRGHEPLRAAGAETLVVLPIGPGVGFLLLLDSAVVTLETGDIRLLELLAAHITTSLSTARALEELRVRADTDPLTGLGHHASFHAALGKAATGAERRGNLALVVLDVDGFKDVNDTRGHQAGDELLCLVAEALRETLRPSDIVCRVGGDEFAALITLRDPAHAHATAERLRLAVCRRSGNTASAGVAVRIADEPPSRLLARADAALYRSKRAGRNRTTADFA